MLETVTYPPEKRDQWLAVYADCRSKTEACRRTGITMTTARSWESKFPEFGEAVREVQMWVSDEVGNVALDRALNGYDEPVIYKGEVQMKGGKPVTVKKHSDKLLLAAAEQFAGWGRRDERQVEVRKEVFLIASGGEEMSLKQILAEQFNRAQLAAPRELEAEGKVVKPPSNHPSRENDNGRNGNGKP